MLLVQALCSCAARCLVYARFVRGRSLRIARSGVTMWLGFNRHAFAACAARRQQDLRSPVWRRRSKLPALNHAAYRELRSLSNPCRARYVHVVAARMSPGSSRHPPLCVAREPRT